MAIVLLSSCDEKRQTGGGATAAADGNIPEGKRLVQYYGCSACHVVPGITGASGAQGPSLERFADRDKLAGGLANTFENTVKWILDPQAIKPGTAMPKVAATEAEARDMAAYLRSAN
jgi:cytochrome c1